MEQQQCPICMLYLLPGMNLQDHLDTHPKDMIIKALLSAKTEPPKPAVSNDAAATVFLTSTQFNPPQTHIYQDPQQQQQNQQPNSFALAKRHPNNGGNTVLFNNRPYRLTLDAPQAVAKPATTTFLNPNSNYVQRQSAGNGNEGDLFDNKGPASFRCIQNTEQKNIMIVNTSSTQYIQQTLPVKKPSATAIELHPVIIDNTGMSISAGAVPNAISIIPRYTSEKYSGPPPSYSTAISSVTNTLNDKPRVIDLTQTPTISTMKMMEKHCGSNNNTRMTTLSGSGAGESRHLMIRGQPMLEYTQTDDGNFLITEKQMSPNQPSTSQALTVSHEEEVIAESPGTSASKYTIKYVDVENQLTFDIMDDGATGKFQAEQQFLIEESQEMMQQDCEEVEERVEEPIPTPAKNHNGVKVLSNVKLTSSEMFSPSIKDIIKQYNNQTESIHREEAREAMDEAKRQEEELEEQFSSIHCTETLNLSKDKDDSTAYTTSVIRKTNDEADATPTQLETQKKDEPQPSTSGLARNSNVVFKLNPQNRLKANRQPKKLIVKLKRPLVEIGECSSSPAANTAEVPPEPLRVEPVAIKREVACEKSDTEVESTCKPENVPGHYDPTFLDTHDYDHVSTIKVTPDIHHDSETNQSCLSMDLEPETHAVKCEQADDDFPIVIKTEMNACTSSFATSASSSSCSNSSPGPSRLTVESATSTNDNSPLNFLYQNDRVRFSPPLSPYVYLKTFSSTQSDDQPKQEADISWNGSNSLAIQNSDHNSTSSRYTPSFDDNRSNYTDLDGGNNKTNSSAADGHIRAPSTDSLNIRTDEKMPARGEISEQESNGEIEQPWHHPVSHVQV